MTSDDKFRFTIVAEFHGATEKEAMDNLKAGRYDNFTIYDKDKEAQ
jgi:hypothetical protein